VYLPSSGWVGFDPTIGETTSSKHTVVGVSHHPRGVMPISGQYTGSRANYMGLEVQVKIQPLDAGGGDTEPQSQPSSSG